MTAPTGREVVISPFANERMREWSQSNFRRLIELILERHNSRVAIIGTRAQRPRANDLVRGFPASAVLNTCGSLNWREVIAKVDGAYYVVANNSGIAHLSAARNVWTLCIFAGSHAWNEWMPRGPRVVVVTKSTSCAPCEVGAERCPNGLACMTKLAPEDVFEIFDETLVGFNAVSPIRSGLTHGTPAVLRR